MSEDKNRPRGPREVVGQEDEQRPRRKTRFIFKLAGLGLVILAAWMAWYTWRAGHLIDWRDPAQQIDAMRQAEIDLNSAKKKSVEVSAKALSWAQCSLEESFQRSVAFATRS